MAGSTVVVLGAGSGGLVASRTLRRNLARDDRVILVDQSPLYRFAPSFLWVMSGARAPRQVTADLSRIRRHGMDLRTTGVLGIDTAARTVATTTGEIAFDRLVVSLGADVAPDALPGFAAAALTPYTLEGAEAAYRALARFEGGRLAVLVSRLPYKCPAAPYETALLADALLRRRGVRARTTIDVYTPEPFPMPTAGPVLGEALREILASRNIGFHPTITAERIDADAREIVFAGGETAAFDLLLGVPPHRAPEAVAGLATGFVSVDAATLETEVPGVFAIGDVTAIPIAGGKFLPKAGVFAHAEARVVARRIADDLAGRAPSATFDGAGACFVEMGDGVAAYATGTFYGEAGPAINLRRPGRRWHLAKVAFEKYWMHRWL